MFLHSFAFKLGFYILTAVILIFISVLIYNYTVSRNALLKDIEEDTSDLTNTILYKTGSVFSKTEQVPKILSLVLEYGNLTDVELLNIIRNIVSSDPEIYGCTASFEPYKFSKDKYYFGPYFCKSDEGIRYQNLGTPQYNYFKWDWYTKPKNAGTGVWSEPYFGLGGNVFMVTYSQPIYKNTNGKRDFLGTAVCDVALDWLVDYFESLNLPGTGYAFLISANGTFIVHKNRFYVMKETIFSLAEKRKDDNLKKLGEKMVKGETGFVKYFSDTLKKQCYLRYVPFVVVKGWSIGIVIPEEELFYDLKIVTIKLFIMGFIGYLMALVIVIILAHKTTIPLRSLANATEKIGTGNFQTQLPKISSNDEIGILSRSFRTMQENLVKYIDNLQETTAAKEKIEKELSIARDIQQSLIPHNFPKIKQFDMYATLIPAREIGGDLYDFFFIDEKHFCFAIGDVSGKGVPAALFMAVTRTLLRAKSSHMVDPATVLSRMSEDLYKENESCMFATFFLGILNIETGFLEYCNAGHNPPLIHTASKGFYYFSIENGFPPLGAKANMNYVGNSIQLLPEDIFFLYTDGVTEAMNTDYVQFSEEKLLNVLTQNKDETVSNIVNNVKTAIERHASGAVQSDDISMFILKYNG